MVAGLRYAAEMTGYQATLAQRRGDIALYKELTKLEGMFYNLADQEEKEITEKTLVTLCQSCGKFPSVLCRPCVKLMISNSEMFSY